ncbi:site-specific recombinase, phage integrase family [Ancylostoma ceylanicum]|uniref:Site-specific recombinase, phage integrase family n=1 Tax=Ancylostoma ceylanicum TaxID=53326 RepID=A0A0D6M7F7_9BILA|nr:site-specific recombinase, phage integrase family [Ancylostoma ceylanicum]
MESGYWMVRIRRSKTDQDGQGSNVFIGREPTFDEALARCQHRQVHGFLLASTDGRKWSSNAAASEVKRICAFAGIRPLSPHSFRRGGATNALDKGTDVDAVRRRALAYERLGRKPEEASKWAVLDEMVRARRKSDGERARQFAKEHEINALLSALPRFSWPQWRKDRAHVLLVLLFYGLLRISEAVSLEGEDFTMESGYWMVRIRRSKTDQDGQGSNVFIGREPTFDEALARCQHRQVHGFLLASTDGRKWSSNAAASEVKRICAFAGIRPLSPHSFRRGGATNALDKGTDVDAVRRRGFSRWRALVLDSVRSAAGPVTKRFLVLRLILPVGFGFGFELLSRLEERLELCLDDSRHSETRSTASIPARPAVDIRKKLGEQAPVPPKRRRGQFLEKGDTVGKALRRMPEETAQQRMSHSLFSVLIS